MILDPQTNTRRCGQIGIDSARSTCKIGQSPKAMRHLRHEFTGFYFGIIFIPTFRKISIGHEKISAGEFEELSFSPSVYCIKTPMVYPFEGKLSPRSHET